MDLDLLDAEISDVDHEVAVDREELLEKTKSLYKQGKIYAKPTTLFYNAVIDAHARSHGGREAAERAEVLLDEIEVRGRVGDSELCLTTRSYNAAILAWKNSNCTDAPERAEALLKKMNARYKAGDEVCRPDRVTINSIIGVWARSHQPRAALRAEEFLQFMEKLYEAGDPMIKPDRYSYNTVIDASRPAVEMNEDLTSRFDDSTTTDMSQEMKKDRSDPGKLLVATMRVVLATTDKILLFSFLLARFIRIL